MNLIRQLAKYFPDWRQQYTNPLDAAASIGLLEEDDDESSNPLELDFDGRVYPPEELYDDEEEND